MKIYRFNDEISGWINWFCISELSCEGKGLHKKLQNKWPNYFRNWSTTSALLSHHSEGICSSISYLCKEHSNFLQLLLQLQHMAKNYSTSQMKWESLYISKVTTCSQLESLAVWMLRESKRTLPDFCNKAAIRTFQIKKMNSWDEAIDRIKGLAIITGSLELIISRTQSWKEYQLCNGIS